MVFTRNINKTLDWDKDLDCYIYGEHKIGDTLVSQEEGEYDDKIYNHLNKDEVNGGFVCAYLSPNDVKGGDIYRCVIPAFTPFIISDNLKEVAAKKLIVTEKVASIPEQKEVLSRGYVDCLRHDLFKYTKDCFGYFVLESGNTINPYNYIGDGKDVVAVVVNIHDEVAKIIALKEKSLEWCTIPCDKTKVVTKNALKDKALACKDLNGYQNTLAVTKSKRFVYQNYPAIQFCRTYSYGNYNEGRWFLGSAADIVAMVRNNMLLINAALAILQYRGGDCDLLGCDWYWSSTEFHENSVWDVTADSGFLGCNVKSKRGGVRPMTIINLSTR